jgi:hypothetical protein
MAQRRIPPIDATIESVLKAGRGYPEPQWLADYRGISVQDAYSAIQRHYDTTDWGELAAKKPEMPPMPSKKDLKDKNPWKNKSNDDHFHELPKGVLRIIFALVSIIAGIRSFGFVYGWFSQWDNGFMSVAMAVIITVSMICLPQAAIILFRERRWFLFGISIFLVVVMVSFSMVTTVQGLYSSRSTSLKNHSEANAANSKTADEIKRLEDRGLQITADKLQDTQERSLIPAKMQQYDPGTIEYNRLATRLQSLKERIDGANNELTLIQKRIDSKVSDKVYIIERDDFFTYLEGVTIIPKANLEFGTSISVSVVIDIAGPVFATIAMFL